MALDAKTPSQWFRGVPIVYTGHGDYVATNLMLCIQTP